MNPQPREAPELLQEEELWALALLSWGSFPVIAASVDSGAVV